MDPGSDQRRRTPAATAASTGRLGLTRRDVDEKAASDGDDTTAMTSVR